MNKQIILILLSLSVLVLCSTENLGIDPNSRSNTVEVYTQTLYMNWNLNLMNKTLNGTTNFQFIALSDNVTQVYLDVWNELDLLTNGCGYIPSGTNKSQNVNCTIQKFNDTTEDQGDTLIITLPSPIRINTVFNITVKYSIDNHDDAKGQDGSRSIKFIDANLTPSKKYPVAFSHSQMIYARSLSPFQDSPAVKFTWKADVEVYPNIGSQGFYMTGDTCGSSQDDKRPDVISFCYEQDDFTNPAYQIGFIAGDLKRQQVIGTLSFIITFPEWMEEGYEYLQNSQMYMKALENYLELKYPYDRVNVVIPPLDFPYSSMENGNLIFISRSVIPNEDNMGDELGHFILTKAFAKAWFGTQVNIANWESFWLTEGITTFVARQAIKSLFDFNYNLVNLVGNQSMFSYIREIYQKEGTNTSNTYLTMTPKPDRKDPLRALNPVIREKTNQFLEYLQNFVITPDYMREFLNQYITNHTGKGYNLSVTTEEFRESYDSFLSSHYFQPEIQFNKSDIDGWTTGLGMPKKEYEDKLLSIWYSKDVKQILAFAEQFFDMRGIAVPKNFIDVARYWSANQVLLFLSYFQNNIDIINRSKYGYRLFKTMDTILDLSMHRALEVKAAFVEVSLRSDYREAVELPLKQILSGTGNLEIILPLYQTLVDIGQKTLAQTIYDTAKKYYHPIAVSRIYSVLQKN